MRSAKLVAPATIMISIPEPVVRLVLTLNRLGNSFVVKVSGFVVRFARRLDVSVKRAKVGHFVFRLWERRPRLSPKKFLLVALGIFLIGVFFWGKNNSSLFVNRGSGIKMTIRPAIATQVLSREFSFPIEDERGKVLTNVTYVLETAELRDEIIVRGQKATAVSGKTFLILAIKIANSYNKAIEVNSRDFIRLSVNGNEKEWLAADIHNDPVNVRAESTKTTRIGYAIAETDRKLVLRVGEIDGEKETIALSLR